MTKRLLKDVVWFSVAFLALMFFFTCACNERPEIGIPRVQAGKRLTGIIKRIDYQKGMIYLKTRQSKNLQIAWTDSTTVFRNSKIINIQRLQRWQTVEVTTSVHADRLFAVHIDVLN